MTIDVALAVFGFVMIQGSMAAYFIGEIRALRRQVEHLSQDVNLASQATAARFQALSAKIDSHR